MRTLFLHIGTPKTGTSALQWFFFQNRDLLKKVGITYPEFGIVDDCHHRIGASFHHPDVRPSYIQYKDMLTLEEYADMIKAIDGDVLISSELIAHGDLASKLRAAIGDIDIRVIVYLRRQDSFLESWYNQEVKLLSGEGIQEFHARAGGLLDYQRGILEGWAGEWGDDRIIVRVYEKATFARRTICEDFVEHVLGWKIPHGFVQPPPLVNPSLCVHALDYKRAVNNLPLPDEVKCVLSTTMVNYSLECESCEGCGGASRAIMDRELRSHVLECFRESNAWVARTFLGRQDGRLFAEPSTEHADEPQRGLSKEKIVEISRYIERDVPELYAMLREAVGEGLRAEQGVARTASELLSAGIP
jgi:hypothetical protein